MEVKIDSLIPFDRIINDPGAVFTIVDKNDKVLLLKNNQPAYIIMKFDPTNNLVTNASYKESVNITLQEAMRLVLLEAENHAMHASELADEIYNRRLYLQKNGGKAQYNQIRARCGHYPDMFEAMSGNVIKLKDGVEK